MDDLERLLTQLVKENRPLARRFIITEALSEYAGDMVGLPGLLEIKEKYKFRIILDETWSYGILGQTGRGLDELKNVDATSIDIIVGSLAGCISSGGVFCTSAALMVEHQRVNSPAVTFSASLPTFLATTASENPVIISRLRDGYVQELDLTCSEQEAILQDCVDDCLSSHNILVSRLKSFPLMGGMSPRDAAKEWSPRPAFKVCVTSGSTQKEIERAGTGIRHSVAAVMKRPKWQAKRA
ncbi:hypothetical protein MBLNU230_g1609t1 [Neophaeotheca triangularis]